MPSVQMTALWLAKLTPSPERVDYNDTTERGLQLRVGTASMVWYLVYRKPNGPPIRLKLGKYPHMSLAEARAAARKEKAKIDAGHDPAAEHRAAKLAPTFAEVAAEYLEHHAVHKRTAREDRRILDHDLLPAWAHLKMRAITRRDIIALLDAIKARGAPIMANRTLALISKIFNFALDREIVAANPCFRLRKPAPERSRERWLNDDEIRALWEALESEGTTGTVFKILLLTAQRKGEVQGMSWDEIDFETTTWTIPPQRSKNKRSHLVPLSKPVIDLLAAQQQHQAKSRISPYVFPSPRPYRGHITQLGKAVQRLKSLSGVDFHIHDLRRTAATGMARLGVDRTIIAKILNHTDRSVTAIYERHAYEREMRAALDLWADHVMGLVHNTTLPDVSTAEKITPIRTKRR